ncbi:PspC domain-containing protein [Mucilaginibacter sp. PAMB04168]|uniref:PspC domain-containing protein n=1 Tax=Mucilaginibacter sp. PAMB04168 TaxID=3138567 RepID=UPI0031F67DB3
MNSKRLYRDELNKTVGGVCKGLADYFDIDVSIIRALFVLALVLKGSGVLLYIVLWIVLPKKENYVAQPGVDYTVPPMNPEAEPAQPFVYKTKSKGSFGLVAGTILIVLGGILLLDEFNIIPDWDFSHLWPVPLVIIGLMLIFSAGKKNTTNPNPPIA